MLSPDEFHPTKIKLRGKNVQVIVPATEIDGKSYLLYRGVVDERISMKFEGGVFDTIGAGLFLKGKLTIYWQILAIGQMLTYAMKQLQA